MTPPNPNANRFNALSDEAKAQRRAEITARTQREKKERSKAEHKAQSQAIMRQMEQSLGMGSSQSTQPEGQIQSQARTPTSDVDVLVRRTAAGTRDLHATPEPEDSMQGVVQGASRQTPEDRDAYLRKRNREWEREEEAKGKKLRGNSPEPSLPMVQVPSDAMDIVEEVNELANVSRREIENPARHQECSLAVWPRNASPDMVKPIGSPFTAATLGWSVNVSVDAGRYGLPQIALTFRVNKPRKDKKGVFTNVMKENVTNKAGDFHQFEAIWRPGVRVQSAFNIDNVETAKRTDAPAIVRPIPWSRRFDGLRLGENRAYSRLRKRDVQHLSQIRS